MTTAEIASLPKIERLAGYLKVLAELDACGAMLRTTHATESNDYDEKWTPEEEMWWDACCDQCDPWWDALSKEEKASLNPIIVYMACLCRGEDPDEHLKLSVEFVPTGKYGSKSTE